MSFPSFSVGEVLTAADMNAVGLWLVKTQTVGTGVSSVTVTNAFSSAYDNYRVTYSGGTQSAAVDVFLQLGPQTTQSEYYGVLVFASTAVGTTNCATNNNNIRADWIGGGDANQHCHVSVDLMGPFLTRYTKIRNGSYQNGNNYGTYQGEHRKATSYTDLILGVAGGPTLTGGTIRVYGYRN